MACAYDIVYYTERVYYTETVYDENELKNAFNELYPSNR